MRGADADSTEGMAGSVLAKRIGLRLDPSLRSRLARCVGDEAAAHSLDVPAYVGRLETDPDLLQGLIDRVTVQETAFFRHPTQFEGFRDFVLPHRMKPTLVWSAGCANGQEPYSLAMILAEAGIADWRVLASDISARALDRTRRARYTERELRDVSPARRERHFTRVGDEWEVVEALRSRVHVVRHNVATDPPPFDPGSCDAAFCRNVLIYLKHDDVVSTLGRLAQWLAPRGWLFLGYAETLWQVTDRFDLVRLAEGFAYRPSPPPRPIERPRAATVPAPSPQHRVDPGSTVALMAEGEAAMNAGDYRAAIGAYRKCAYLDPNHPVCNLHLGLAHEAAGDPSAAARAYSAARGSLRRNPTAAVEATLEGYQIGDLLRLLDTKLSTLAPSA